MVNFSLVPPEVNSALVYSAPGSDKLGALAAEWDFFAMGLYAIAASYEGVVAKLIRTWPCPSAIGMAGAAAHYATRVTAMAAQAAYAGTKAKPAEKSFNAVFAMTVPPLVIAANRAWLVTLVTTNLLGQNAQAIAAADTHYLEMWAQDAVAMNGYVIGFNNQIKTPPSSKPTTVPLTPASMTPTVAAAYDAGLPEIFANPTTEVRWTLSSLMAPGWLPNIIDHLASPKTAPLVPEAAGATDAAIAPERLAMYPVSMLAKAAQMRQTGASELTSQRNGLLSGFGQLVGRTAESAVEELTDQALVWVANVSVQVAQALTLGALSIPRAWLAAVRERGRAAPEPPLTGMCESSAAGSMRRKAGQTTMIERVATGAWSPPPAQCPTT